MPQATEPYAFTILTPGVEGTEVGQAYRLEAENQERGAWLWVQAGVSWRQLAVLRPPPARGSVPKLCQAPGQEPSSPPHPSSPPGLWPSSHPQSPLQVPGVA